jgi:predicted nuclease of predicted toxin-antitoxin system
VKFLVDAQLPRRLAIHLQGLGYDVLHTLDLPDGNRTTDAVLNQISVRDQRILITKDSDFVSSFLLQGQPLQLLLIATGNINNVELISLIDHHLPSLANAFSQSAFVELNHRGLVLHA